MNKSALFSFRSAAATLAVSALLLSGCGDSSSSSSSSSAPSKPSAAPATGAAGSAPKSGTAAASAPAAAAPAAGEAPFVLPNPTDAGGAPVAGGPADAAWAAIEKAFSSPPTPPESWATTPPTADDKRAFQRKVGEMAGTIAEQVKDFYAKFPADPRAAEARWREMQLLSAAVSMGQTNLLTRLEGLEKERLADPKTGDDEKFALRMASAQRTAEAQLPQGEAAAKASLAESARKLIADFPKHSEPYMMLLNLVEDDSPEKVRATAQSMISTNVPEEAREAAQAVLKKLDLLGQPLDLKFTAIDGREVDVAKLRGKVVLVDFWATWCGPCVAELPKVKAAYEKLNPQGFEIVGISFDQDKEALQGFVKDQKMPWVQYFDGKGWENAFGARFGITGIPAMWLVDKKGVLRDMEARKDLEGKVTKLLAEGADAK